MDTLSCLAVDEQEAVDLVATTDLELEKLLADVRAKISRDRYPLSICVDGIASR